MSIKLMTAVWDLQLAPSDKLVLLALADNANDEGACWPSMATLVTKTSLAERTVQGCIRNLQRAGLVSVFENAGRSNTYHVTPAEDAPPQKLHPRSSCTPPPQPLHPTPAAAAPTPAAAAPRTIIEPSREPSKNRHTYARDPEAFDSDWLDQVWPTATANNRDHATAIHHAMALVSLGHVTWPVLRGRVEGFAAYCRTGGFSPHKTPGMVAWFRHDHPEKYWAREWRAVPSKGEQRMQDNIDASQQWLREQEEQDRAAV